MRYKSVAITPEAAAGNGVFCGYGSVFGVIDNWGDRILPGAFKDTLQAWREKSRMPKLLWQHKSDQPVGVWETMEEDDHGLKMRGRLLIDDLPKAREVYALLKAGAVDGLSIGYTVKNRQWNEQEHVNELNAVHLLETSIVTFPANEAAVVGEVKTGEGEESAPRATEDLRAALAILQSINGE